MQAQTAAKQAVSTRPHFSVAELSQSPGIYAATAVDDQNEGTIIAIEFWADNSKQLAEEYAAWKNLKA